MRKLTSEETRLLTLIEKAGGSWRPDDTARAEPAIMNTLNALARKKRLTVEADDDQAPRFHLTAQGRADAKATHV